MTHYQIKYWWITDLSINLNLLQSPTLIFSKVLYIDYGVIFLLGGLNLLIAMIGSINLISLNLPIRKIQSYKTQQSKNCYNSFYYYNLFSIDISPEESRFLHFYNRWSSKEILYDFSIPSPIKRHANLRKTWNTFEYRFYLKRLIYFYYNNLFKFDFRLQLTSLNFFKQNYNIFYFKYKQQNYKYRK